MKFAKIPFARWLAPGLPPEFLARHGNWQFNWLTLNFPKELEEEFRRDYAQKSVWHVRLGIALGVLVWLWSGLLDNRIYPEVVIPAGVIRYAVVVPSLTLIFLLTFSSHFHRVIQLAAGATYLITALGIIILSNALFRRTSAPYSPALLLAVPYACTLLRLRFVNAACLSLIVVAADNIAIVWLRDIPFVLLLYSNFFLFSACFLGLVAGYNMEVYIRRDFLQRRAAENSVAQLESANLAKSRFLAAASHDLRQPLHALGLFVAQLREGRKGAEQAGVVEQIETAVGAMNEMFNALLDIAKLDAGVLAPNRSEFPIAHLLERLETNFAGPAREKGLRLRVFPSTAWVSSDFILLERILLNLVANAVRYTGRGGVLVACRKRGDMLRVEVYDTGPGIPESQRHNIFGEFYQLADAGRERRGGLGLGLAIVERLCRLLEHPIELTSTVGRGSRFTVVVPAAPARPKVVASALPIATDAPSGKLVVVIDDDALVLDGMRGLLQGWGCNVVTAATEGAALAELGNRRPDLIISDSRLADGVAGIDVIARLRQSFGGKVPAFLISGDTGPERLREARAGGHHLLHKPVHPMMLRAMLSQLLKEDARASAIDEAVLRS